MALPSDDLSAPHRKDIDGLRAIAVIPVILFHFGMKRVSGGFVGVDIFFVISGFLITQLIYRENGNGTYSAVGFYNRRMRRIFPALFTVLTFCIFASFFIDFPKTNAETGRSIVAAVFFVSNIFFYSKSGYFDSLLQLNPILHTWSLAVEEQFYLVFPIAIFALRSFSERWRSLAVFMIAAASLIYS